MYDLFVIDHVTIFAVPWDWFIFLMLLKHDNV